MLAKHLVKYLAKCLAKNGVIICEKMRVKKREIWILVCVNLWRVCCIIAFCKKTRKNLRKKREIFVAKFVEKVAIFEAILAIYFDLYFDTKEVKKEVLVGFVVALFGYLFLRDECQTRLIKSLALCSNLKIILHILISYDFWRDDNHHFALLFYGFFVRKKIFYQRNRA